MIANRTPSLRQRREINTRESLSIRIDPLSNGEWRATLIEQARPDDIERYVSAGMPTPSEALSLAEWEMDQLVEKRVDAIYAQEEAAELADMNPEQRARYWAEQA